MSLTIAGWLSGKVSVDYGLVVAADDWSESMFIYGLAVCLCI